MTGVLNDYFTLGLEFWYGHVTESMVRRKKKGIMGYRYINKKANEMIWFL
jgi:hypothetical protein